ncbi:MAG: RDD family protein [Acidimicrobiia bacterium]
MTDHYELFGVEPDATKDEIKAAYRSEVEAADSARRAQLNRAWNVLSDPVQRARYDEQLTTGDDEVDDDSPSDADGSGRAAVPARRTTGARRGPESKVLKADRSASNGSGKNGSGGKDGGPDNADDRPLGRPVPEPTVVLPEGMHLAAKKQRGFSILFDLSVCAVLYILFVSVLIPMVLKDQYPKEVDRLDAISTQTDKLNKQKSTAQDNESKFNDQADAAKAKGDTAAQTEAKNNAKAAANTADSKDRQIKKLENETSDLQGKMIGTTYLLLGGLLILCLLYLVPSTVMTGQTLGKRLRKVWLVRTDGSRAGFGAVFTHSALPVVIALAVPQLGPVIALGIVFWALRDRNEQGVHDKLAKTLVVDAPPAA